MPTFPVDLAAYLGGCARMHQQVFDLGEGLQVQHQTAGGEVLRMGGAARLWRGSLTLYPLRHDDARALHAKLHTLRGTGASFYIGDMTHKGGTAAGQIKGINGTTRDILTLQGAPVGLVIAPGDYIAWDYSGRRALHQVVVGRTVNASGETGNIEIVPPMRTLPAIGTVVAVGAAKCRAVMLPGTARVGTSNIVATMGVSFDWTQTLRENP